MAKGNFITRNVSEGRTIPRARFGLSLNQQARERGIAVGSSLTCTGYQNAAKVVHPINLRHVFVTLSRPQAATATPTSLFEIACTDNDQFGRIDMLLKCISNIVRL